MVILGQEYQFIDYYEFGRKITSLEMNKHLTMILYLLSLNLLIATSCPKSKVGNISILDY